MTSSLWDMRAGETACLVAYDERLDIRYRTRLRELGFHPGARVVCVRTPRFGAPHVYRVGTSIFSLEDSLARHVLVEVSDRVANTTLSAPAA
ncbi:MAG: FeoA family protein [Pseudomonadales bacterium]|jgi:Fe2+ transport system protein FeoA|nr:FeoA family protein [Pseudomonadales bacterium]